MVLIAIAYWQFFSGDPEASEVGAKVISAVLAVMFTFSFVVSVLGCDRCVARVCGRASY